VSQRMQAYIRRNARPLPYPPPRTRKSSEMTGPANAGKHEGTVLLLLHAFQHIERRGSDRTNGLAALAVQQAQAHA
jgi:hypothetical protein